MVSYQPTSAKSAYQCVSKIYPSTGPSQFSCKRKKKMIKDPARNTLTNSELDNFNREYPTKWELFWANWAGMRSSTPKVQDDKAPSSSLRCRFAIQKPPLLRSKCWQGQSPVERHTNANSNSLKLQGNGKGEAWKSENPLLWETAPGWAKLQYLKVNAVLQNLLFFLLKLTIHSGAVCCPIAMSHSPNKPSVPALVPPPKFSVTKNWNKLAFPDFSCSSAVWVMLWTTLASRTCQRIHKKRLKQIPSVLLYYPLPSNIAVATKVEHVDTPYHCFLMPQERLKISGVTKPTVPAVKIPILSYTSKSNITAQKSKNED